MFNFFISDFLYTKATNYIRKILLLLGILH